MTVTHVVLIRWSTQDVEEQEAVKDAVRRLPDRIPGILDLREGASNSPEGLEAGFEYGFVITFPDAAARDAYLVHPEHVPVGERIGRASEKVLVYDL